MGLTGVLAVPDGAINSSNHGYTNFQMYRNPHNVLDATSVTLSKFHTEDPQILVPTYTTLFARRLSTWNLGAPALEGKKVG